MLKSTIPGTVICRRRDEHGEIVIADNGNMRSLYFGGVMQSAIRTDVPDLLLEDYHEAMMSALLFHDAPRSILLIGLGGSSLVHFLLKAAPDAVLDVVEIRQLVIELSREFFLLPHEDARLRITHAAGNAYIRLHAKTKRYDMIIVDAFDESGPAASLLEKDFFPPAACN